VGYEMSATESFRKWTTYPKLASVNILTVVVLVVVLATEMEILASKQSSKLFMILRELRLTPKTKVLPL
jgi:hypothetical protein